MKEYLLISCTKTKMDLGTKLVIPRDYYSGSKMFRHLVELAEIHGLKVLVRSGKYGFISLDQLIEPYDQRLVGEPIGTYPLLGDGYWFGPEDYFADAPDSFERLIPKMTYGKAESALLHLKHEFEANRKYLFGGGELPSMRALILGFFNTQWEFRKVVACNVYLQARLGAYRDYTKAIKVSSATSINTADTSE